MNYSKKLLSILLLLSIGACAHVDKKEDQAKEAKARHEKKVKEQKLLDTLAPKPVVINNDNNDNLSTAPVLLSNRTQTFYYQGSNDTQTPADLYSYLQTIAGSLKNNDNAYVSIYSVSYEPNGGSTVIADKRATEVANILAGYGLQWSKIRKSSAAYSDKNFDSNVDKTKLNSIQITVVSN